MECRIVYKPNKSVSIIHPAPKSRRPGESKKKWLARVFSKAMQEDLKGLPFEDTDTSVLPKTREKRSQWRGEKGKKVWIEESAPTT